MISPRLLPLSTGCYDGTTIMAKTGHQIAQAENIDDAKYIVACVNAFHESGTDPADLPKFIEAVRAWHKYLPTIANKQPGVQEWISLVHHGNEAAACLPENKGKQHGRTLA